MGIYAPFILIANKINSRRADRTFRELYARVTTPVAPAPNTFERSDEVALLARTLLADLEYDFRSQKNLFLQYQPQIAADSGRVVGAEALLRWRHPYHGLVPAPVTVALAEASGLIQPLGMWIFDAACATRREWLDEGVEDLVMAVNFSSQQFSEGFLAELAAILQKHRLTPDLLELEITESGIFDGRSAEGALVEQMHALGLRIAIDNFGMGHGSLKYIKQFPITTVKIDGVITREVVTNPICADIVSSITRLCRARRMTSIAELVESDAQAAVLRTLGVDTLQGYTFSRLLSAKDCLAFIKNTNTGVALNGVHRHIA